MAAHEHQEGELPEDNKEETPQLAEFRLVFPNYEDASMLYSNFQQISVTPHDVTFHFGHYIQPLPHEAPTEPIDVHIRPVANVTVPLNLVRGLMRVLQGQMENWERSFGQEIPSQPDQSDKLSDPER